jgi:mono/diheme cytochrome c family protein
VKRYFLGIFADEEGLVGATEAVRAKGLRIFDIFTPYPVHGLDEAMGLLPSRLGRVCFGFGVLGVALAFAMQYWTSAVDWPINVGGRPWNSWPAFVPVAFEVMVLLASFGVVFAFLAAARLFPGRKSLSPAAGVTDDRFVLVLEETDAAFDAREVQALLGKFGVEETFEREASPVIQAPSSTAGKCWKRINLALVVAVVLVLALNLSVGTNPERPNMEFLPDMAHPVSYHSFAANSNFSDGRTLQSPVDGTVPRGHMPLHFGPGPEDALRAGKELKSPLLPEDKRAKQLGPVLFAHHCLVCHGPEGKGDGPVTLRGVPPPPSLLAEKTVATPDGQIFHVLTFGQQNMASYATHLSVEERWYVIDHLRAMQKQAGGK